jgi:hypothetical protein
MRRLAVPTAFVASFVQPPRLLTAPSELKKTLMASVHSLSLMT